MLRTWFRWRGNSTIRKKAGSVVLAAAIPRSRQLQDTEVYSKLFYESKLKDIIEEESADKTLTHAERLAKIVEVTKREWSKESDQVKAQVEATKLKLREEHGENQPSEGKVPSAMQYQAAIDNLSYTATAFLRHIKQTTNWTGFMVFGGPKPDIGDDIAITSYADCC